MEDRVAALSGPKVLSGQPDRRATGPPRLHVQTPSQGAENTFGTMVRGVTFRQSCFGFRLFAFLNHREDRGAGTWRVRNRGDSGFFAIIVILDFIGSKPEDSLPVSQSVATGRSLETTFGALRFGSNRPQ